MEVIRTLKALADPLRLRVLAAVAEEELTVGEVQEVVASVQSAVSRNLAILREAGFVQDRKEGTNVYFSVRRDMPVAAREFFKSVQARWPELPESKGDKERLEACRRRRARRSRNYFESVAGDWERIRTSFFADRVTSLAIAKLLPRNLVVADVGCGTGSLSFELARFARKVIGIDLSGEMLRRAREVAKEREIRNVDFRRADALKLPLDSRSVDAVFCVMVLHFLPDPERAIAELCRVTRRGGSVIVVDLVQHSQEWMREQMAHRWLGFARQSIEKWFRAAGVKTVDYDLTGSYAGEKIARNGNRPVEIFVARACLPSDATRNRTRKAKR
ncbi:MAG: metalloregulator ArsR/SmtB family transcription factor [Deltaproteobacteria bacterium]|nr:metalloregulator ArsR/SmtB family transcription factor [Deltaproteobacteria bacterium]MBI2229549.1 metalloregulator ArsR/SmtB family transcription factor [Deltaproteobacteria bacterium]MBI2534483.1 metalloregulator ArsR/SmtB family transcription factor [Deltaproteobacteria bacterium]